MAPQVSILGLGAMGTALASAFLKAGYRTTVWNRTAAKAKPLVDNGAHHASSAAECIGASGLVIICVLDKDTVRDILRGVPAAALDGSNKVIVNFTNGSPDGARETASLVHTIAGPASAIKYVQGGIMAVPQMIGLPHSVILYSGDQEGFRLFESDLAVLGASKFLGTDVGIAPLHDQAMLSGMYGLFSGFLHAVAMVRADKNVTATATQFTTELLVPWLVAMTGYLLPMAGQVDAGDFASDTASLGMQRVALDTIIESSEALGVRADVLRPIYGMMVKRIEAGGSGEDISALVEVFGMEN
jgi:3-hydroxyisobutyrate dehydrogenase